MTRENDVKSNVNTRVESAIGEVQIFEFWSQV